MFGPWWSWAIVAGDVIPLNVPDNGDLVADELGGHETAAFDGVELARVERHRAQSRLVFFSALRSDRQPQIEHCGSDQHGVGALFEIHADFSRKKYVQNSNWTPTLNMRASSTCVGVSHDGPNVVFIESTGFAFSAL